MGRPTKKTQNGPQNTMTDRQTDRLTDNFVRRTFLMECCLNGGHHTIRQVFPFPKMVLNLILAKKFTELLLFEVRCKNRDRVAAVAEWTLNIFVVNIYIVTVHWNFFLNILENHNSLLIISYLQKYTYFPSDVTGQTEFLYCALHFAFLEKLVGRNWLGLLYQHTISLVNFSCFVQ